MDRGFAQRVSLTPPPKHAQFATERVHARIKERRARKTVEQALGRRDETGERARMQPSPIEAARIWNLASLRELREALPLREQERTLISLAELRRAAELPNGAPRPSQQTRPSLEDGREH
jgi:hypothetical protein